MALVKQQHKDLDIRFVFMNARIRFTKVVKQPMLIGVLDMIFSGQRKQYRWSGLKMDEDEIEDFVKKMDLAKGNYYIILTRCR